jgi:hypothetical protein
VRAKRHPHSVGLRGNFAANPENVDSPEEPEKMCVKRDPAPRGKLCDSVVPNGLDKVSAARHPFHFHRTKGILRDAGTGTHG